VNVWCGDQLQGKTFTDITIVIDTEYNNRQNINICIRNLDPNKQR